MKSWAHVMGNGTKTVLSPSGSREVVYEVNMLGWSNRGVVVRFQGMLVGRGCSAALEVRLDTRAWQPEIDLSAYQGVEVGWGRRPRKEQPKIAEREKKGRIIQSRDRVVEVQPSQRAQRNERATNNLGRTLTQKKKEKKEKKEKEKEIEKGKDRKGGLGVVEALIRCAPDGRQPTQLNVRFLQLATAYHGEKNHFKFGSRVGCIAAVATATWQMRDLCMDVHKRIPPSGIQSWG
ncbi:hypothetical protein CC1G_14698 [Coprinopsis cinerea okayama7|uniref:Uncharacterized protein n=1 Tax=Coprinopsis cinerea (strain Okayama-7 / 130 / ATCC MYA-4618 / FGSC 9003) TaxID=240176 RepID=D6RML2_COPC7|nr:hypothetical protein CC1G_14698 [Coprinopsis cinerea okayama7\|eukprot:XP_002911269.1 hypothetical protein CC1G_14698 [Coprinopsis cinerea okayama7\